MLRTTRCVVNIPVQWLMWLTTFDHRPFEEYVHGYMCDMVSGVNEPLKVVMECATAVYTWVLLKYKFKSVQFPYKESA